MLRKMIVVVLMACMLTATVALTSAAGCTILNTGMNNIMDHTTFLKLGLWPNTF